MILFHDELTQHILYRGIWQSYQRYQRHNPLPEKRLFLPGQAADKDIDGRRPFTGGGAIKKKRGRKHCGMQLPAPVQVQSEGSQ